MRSLRWLVTIWFCLAASLGAFSPITCAQTAAPAVHPVTLKLSGVPRRDDTDPFSSADRAVLDAFERKHPEVHVVVQSSLNIDGPAFDSGTLMAIAGGVGPDVMYVNFRQLDNYVNQGFLLPLDDYLAHDPHILDKIRPQIKDVIQVDHHVYTIPFQQYVQALYYRKDYFRKAGLDPNQPPRNWDEFYTDAQKLTVPDKGQWGFAFSADAGDTAWWWIDFLWSAGGEVVHQDAHGNAKAAWATPAGVSALEFYRKLVADPWKTPDGRIQRGVAIRTGHLFDDYIARGKVAMWFQYQSNSLASYATANISPSLIGIAPMPKGPTGITGNEINAGMFGINAQQKDPRVRQVAWEYIKFMGSDEADAIRTRAYVDAGLSAYVNPISLNKYGYSELTSHMSRAWVGSMEQLMKTGKPEPHGKNCEMLYAELDQPLITIGLYPDRDPARLLQDAAVKTDADLLGYVPQATMHKRREIAWSVFGVLVAALLVPSTLAMRRLMSGIALDSAATSGPSVRTARAQVVPWLFMLPAVLSIAVWAYYPLAHGMLMAFQDYKISEPPRWIGLDNFIEAALSNTFWLGIIHALEFAGLSLGLGFFLPIFLALMLSEVPRGSMFFRVVYYLPAVTAGIVTVFLWKQFYDPSPQGLLNQVMTQGALGINAVLGVLHLPWRMTTDIGIDWLGNPNTAMLAVVLPGIWGGAGPGSIIYLAALKTIPEDLYEAADLDGASAWLKIRRITLPALRPLIIINLVGAFIGTFKATENIFAMTGGGPLYATHTIGLEIWYNAFMYLKFGYATAAAWMMGTLLIGFTVYQLRILRNVRFSAGK